MNQYFDHDEFEESPAKTELKTYYFNMDLDRSYVHDMYWQRNTITTQDYWLSSLIDNKNYTFFEQKTGAIYTGEIIPTKYEMFTIFINKHE